MPDHHLSEDDLILYKTGELSADAMARVTMHLGACRLCRAELENLNELMSAVDAGTLKCELDLLDAKMAQSEPSFLRRPLPFARTRHRLLTLMSATAIGVLGVFAVYVGLISPPVMQARDVLVEASSRASRRAPKPVTIRVRTRGASCLLPAMQIAAGGTDCARVRTALQTIKWNWANPLSARSYLEWHDSLQSKEDDVHIDGDTTRVRTKTAEGALRQAALFLKTADYQPTKAEFDVEGMDTISIEEEVSVASSTELTANRGTTFAPTSNVDLAPEGVRPRRKPADEAEVEAWVALHELNADGGYEADVQRSGDTITIKGYVASAARKQALLTGFQRLKGARVEISTYEDADPGDLSWIPRRRNEGFGPPLGRKLFETNLTAEQSASEESDRALSLSKALLGKTRIVAIVQRRRAAIAECPCSLRLDQLIEDERTGIGAMVLRLLEVLHPITGPIESGNKSIGPEDAEQLDATLLQLLSSSQAGTALDAELETVKRLLSGDVQR